MTTYRIAQMTDSLKTMTVAEADSALCSMLTEDLIAIGEDLGLRLPLVGGDKPACIIGALVNRGRMRKAA